MKDKNEFEKLEMELERLFQKELSQLQGHMKCMKFGQLWRYIQKREEVWKRLWARLHEREQEFMVAWDSVRNQLKKTIN